MLSGFFLMNKFPLLNAMMFQNISTKSKVFLASCTTITVTSMIFFCQLLLGYIIKVYSHFKGEIICISLVFCFGMVIVKASEIKKEF